jgi:hypothetical protein
MSHACPDFRRTAGLTRRRLLTAGSLGFFGINLPRFLQVSQARANDAPVVSAPRARAKSCIFLYQFGGPSHLDTFDPKPDAPDGIRGEFAAIPTTVAGLRFGEHLPRMARLAHKLALVRSVHHTMRNHNPATYYNLTGHAPPIDDIRLRDSPELYPAFGSVVSRFLPEKEGLPTFAALPCVMSDGVVSPGQHASFLGRGYDPFLVREDPAAADFRLPELSLPADTPLERLDDRRRLLELIDRQAALNEKSAAARGQDTYNRRAFAMLAGAAVRKAFDLSAEPAKLRDRYGRTTYGQSCLLARRLVEAGVTFVNVYFAPNIGNAERGGWDTHGNNFKGLKNRLLPMTDQTVPTLLEDLESRGLLDETLVVWLGEFGRSPRVTNTPRFGPDGRDHWPDCYSMWFAGGGTRGGSTFGASDKIGAYPASDAVKPDDIAATIFAAMGIAPESEVRDLFDRPLSIAAGKPIEAIFG